MSGIEFVGVVLGILPLVLETFDRHSAVYEACQTLYRPAKALKRLATTLNVQKALFRSSIFTFLKVITKDERRSQILLSGNWGEFRLASELENEEIHFLGELFQAWKELLELVHQELVPVCDDFQRITSGIKQGQQVSKQIQARINLFLGERALDKRIRKLELQIGNFRSLTETINRSLQDMIKASVETGAVSAKRTAERANRIAPYELIQRSSNKLFSLLAHKWTCSRHRKHWVAITLLDRSVLTNHYNGPMFGIDIKNDDRCLESPQIWVEIQVDMTIPRDSNNETPPEANKETWDDLAVIQRLNGPMNSEKKERTRQKLTKSAPRSMRTQASFGMSSKDAPAASASIGSRHIEVTSTTPTPPDVPPNPKSKNLELLQDLCCYMEKTCSIDGSDCLGFIEDTGIHRFWRRDGESHAQRMTLREILILESRGKNSKGFSRVNIARIGVSLAAAVLQYRSTPWLADAWDSSQVLFLSTIREEVGKESFHPSFSAELNCEGYPNGPGVVERDCTTSPAASVTLNAETLTRSGPNASNARNTSLFCLGVVLSEVGYGKSWSLLREESLQEQRSANQLVQQTDDYFIAEGLATHKNLCRKMGYDYVKIIRKCLGCDFGLGESDLENDELQTRFLDDVVIGLQRIESVVSENSV